MTSKEFDRIIGTLEPDDMYDYDSEKDYWDKYDIDEERGKEIRKYGKIE